MCSEYDIAQKVLFDFIEKRKIFTNESLNNEILQNGGILRIAPNMPIKNKLKEFVQEGILSYSLHSHEYSVVKELF